MTLPDNVFVYLNMDMPAGAREMVCPNNDGTYTILVNGNLTYEMQEEAVMHAIGHITRRDFERVVQYGVQAIEIEAHRKEE